MVKCIALAVYGSCTEVTSSFRLLERIMISGNYIIMYNFKIISSNMICGS